MDFARRRHAPADISAQASQAVRALLASSSRRTGQLSGLQAMLAESAAPLPLLPGDAAALLHSLATGGKYACGLCAWRMTTNDISEVALLPVQPSARMTRHSRRQRTCWLR
jgi:hypothetical protein